jgi:hypothetical protein
VPGRNGRPLTQPSPASAQRSHGSKWPPTRRLQKSLAVEPPISQANAMATETLLEEFALTGVVVLHEVFSEDDASAMREVVWTDLYQTDGVVRDDPSTWHRSTPRRALHHAKRHPVFRKMFGPLLLEMADALLLPGWTVSGGLGNLLVDFRDAEQWYLPGRDAYWHLDTMWSSGMDRLSSLRIFCLFGEVPPGGGGTLLVAGSPHFVRRHAATYPEAARRELKSSDAATLLFRSHPWLAELALAERPDKWDPAYEEARCQKFVGSATDLEGTPAQVIEACGSPGDVFVCHPWTIHCRPPIVSDCPRFIRSPTLFPHVD